MEESPEEPTPALREYIRVVQEAAWNEGHEASYRGVPEEDNPYRKKD